MKFPIRIDFSIGNIFYHCGKIQEYHNFNLKVKYRGTY